MAAVIVGVSRILVRFWTDVLNGNWLGAIVPILVLIAVVGIWWWLKNR